MPFVLKRIAKNADQMLFMCLQSKTFSI